MFKFLLVLMTLSNGKSVGVADTIAQFYTRESCESYVRLVTDNKGPIVRTNNPELSYKYVCQPL